jgi:hypothetical protein
LKRAPLFLETNLSSSPGGRGGGWEKRAGVMRALPVRLATSLTK